ncbi:MAG TPA: thioredoxin domain-containing protein, partial [Candidatus Eisenbacteria bacterium]|nr:thioredoxin domain-containing protein [Candidatus Eisenbacteria bacterium]
MDGFGPFTIRIMANRLAHELSPYLLEHKDNPVDWYPWGEEALQRARAEDKPILLSIGYSACHWCHVMARESFEDADTAALMNRFFVSIKVDREERPDLDQVYMRAVQAMTGSGGWPMTVFLTPDGTPFYGGTYFPPTERHGMASFRRVLTSVAEAYGLRKLEVRKTADQVRTFLQRPVVDAGSSMAALTPAVLDDAYAQLARTYDSRHGGFGDAPKFPQPMLLDFLMRTWLRLTPSPTVPAKDVPSHVGRGTGRAPVGAALEMVTHTLEAMAAGGMYDQLGGGFHRYSVDAHWLVPHFEKMLYDNALLTRAYVDAWLITGRPAFRRVAEETIGFVAREMTSQEGGFFSSLDADSEGEEGRFYVWTPAELQAVLGVEEADRVARAFDVTADGNFEGRNILHAVAPDAPEVMAVVRPSLMAARERRVRPHRDEKILAGWNGLMLRALAEAGRAMERADWLELARRNARFLLARLRVDARMLRSFKDGQARLPGYLEDQAAVADGLLSLYQATLEPEWLAAARPLIDTMLTAFWDEATGAFFDTAVDHESLVVRPQDATDNAVPSGTSLAIDVLVRGGRLFDDERWMTIATRVFTKLAGVAARAPGAFGRLLAALDQSLAPPHELALVGMRSDPALRALARVASRRYQPNLVVAQGSPGEAPPVPWLRDRPPLDGQATAYYCEAFVCQAPTADPAALERQFSRAT